jgi:hypothetical protein
MTAPGGVTMGTRRQEGQRLQGGPLDSHGVEFCCSGARNDVSQACGDGLTGGGIERQHRQPLFYP